MAIRVELSFNEERENMVASMQEIGRILAINPGSFKRKVIKTFWASNPCRNPLTISPIETKRNKTTKINEIERIHSLATILPRIENIE